jgi:hypothetical protein
MSAKLNVVITADQSRPPNRDRYSIALNGNGASPEHVLLHGGAQGFTQDCCRKTDPGYDRRLVEYRYWANTVLLGDNNIRSRLESDLRIGMGEGLKTEPVLVGIKGLPSVQLDMAIGDVAAAFGVRREEVDVDVAPELFRVSVGPARVEPKQLNGRPPADHIAGDYFPRGKGPQAAVLVHVGTGIDDDTALLALAQDAIRQKLSGEGWPQMALVRDERDGGGAKKLAIAVQLHEGTPEQQAEKLRGMLGVQARGAADTLKPQSTVTGVTRLSGAAPDLPETKRFADWLKDKKEGLPSRKVTLDYKTAEKLGMAEGTVVPIEVTEVHATRYGDGHLIDQAGVQIEMLGRNLPLPKAREAIELRMGRPSAVALTANGKFPFPGELELDEVTRSPVRGSSTDYGVLVPMTERNLAILRERVPEGWKPAFDPKKSTDFDSDEMRGSQEIQELLDRYRYRRDTGSDQGHERG